MITVTLGEAKTQEKPFPKLMISNDKTLIVLFFNNMVGFPVNDYSMFLNSTPEHNAAGLWNMDKFTDYNEPITIQNA